MNNRAQKIKIKKKWNEELIINGIKDMQKAVKVGPNVRSFETLNMNFDLFSNWLISSLFESSILFGETKPEIISNGFRYDGLSFL